MMTPKTRFLNACRREAVDRPPVWMMRQAGRYLPEYRKIREKMPTLQMMTDPETACEITLQPVRRLGVDAAILYSDILMVPMAMGLDLDFVKDVGPVFSRAIQTPEDVDFLNANEVPSRLGFVYQTITLLRQKLPPDFPLLGFAGAPFTVGAYMAGGNGAHNGVPLKEMAKKDLRTFHVFMTKLVHATIDYLQGQIQAGVDAIQLFDTWAGTLSPQEYQTLALPYTRQVLENISGAPTILYIKGGAPLFSLMREANPDVIGVDWNISLTEARRLSGGRVAIQGNMNPTTLYEPIPKIEEAVATMIAEWGKGPGYIINLGHGILEDIPVDHAQAFVNAAKKLGRKTVV